MWCHTYSLMNVSQPLPSPIISLHTIIRRARSLASANQHSSSEVNWSSLVYNGWRTDPRNDKNVMLYLVMLYLIYGSETIILVGADVPWQRRRLMKCSSGHKIYSLWSRKAGSLLYMMNFRWNLPLSFISFIWEPTGIAKTTFQLSYNLKKE